MRTGFQDHYVVMEDGFRTPAQWFLTMRIPHQGRRIRCVGVLIPGSMLMAILRGLQSDSGFPTITGDQILFLCNREDHNNSEK